MKITTDKFRQTLQRFVFEHVAPSLNGFAQFMLGAGYGLMETQLGDKLKQFGLVGTDGMVDMDLVDRAVMHGFKASKDSFPVSILGHTITFKPEDWGMFKRML